MTRTVNKSCKYHVYHVQYASILPALLGFSRALSGPFMVLAWIYSSTNIKASPGVLGRFWGDPVSDRLRLSKIPVLGIWPGVVVFPHLGKKHLVLTSAGRWVKVTVFAYMAKFTRKNTPVKVHNLIIVFVYGGQSDPIEIYLCLSDLFTETIFQKSFVQYFFQDFVKCDLLE